MRGATSVQSGRGAPPNVRCSRVKSAFDSVRGRSRNSTWREYVEFQAVAVTGALRLPGEDRCRRGRQVYIRAQPPFVARLVVTFCRRSTMHRSAPLRVAAVVGALLTLGCSLDASPTRPTSALSPATLSAAQVTDVFSIPVGFTIQPSAKVAIEACVGETVTFAGNARVVAHRTILPDGSTSLDLLHFNAQGAVAVGGSTGAAYHLVGGDSNPIVFSPSGGLTATFVANLSVISPGAAPNFTAHILQHISITPAGDLTSLVDVLSIQCG